MKKKSLVAMGLAGVMTIGMCVPVLADDNTFSQIDTTGKDTTVSITEPVSYSVTIPKSVNLTKGAAYSVPVTLGDDAVLETNGKVNVKISGLDNDNKLKLQSSDNAEITSTVALPTDQSLNNAKKSINYELGAVEGLTNAGIYKANITFTISYEGIDFTIPTP